MKVVKLNTNAIYKEVCKNTYYPRPEIIAGSILQKFYAMNTHIPLLLYSNCKKTYHPLANAEQDLHNIIEDEIIREHRYRSLNLCSPTNTYFYMLSTIKENTAVLYVFHGVGRTYVRLVIDDINKCLTLLKEVVVTVNQKTPQKILNKNKNLVDSFRHRIYNPFHKLCFRDDVLENNHFISEVIEDFKFKQVPWDWVSIGDLFPFYTYEKNQNQPFKTSSSTLPSC
jgi:hypothetical protein